MTGRGTRARPRPSSTPPSSPNPLSIFHTSRGQVYYTFESSLLHKSQVYYTFESNLLHISEIDVSSAQRQGGRRARGRAVVCAPLKSEPRTCSVSCGVNCVQQSTVLRGKDVFSSSLVSTRCMQTGARLNPSSTPLSSARPEHVYPGLITSIFGSNGTFSEIQVLDHSLSIENGGF